MVSFQMDATLTPLPVNRSNYRAPRHELCLLRQVRRRKARPSVEPSQQLTGAATAIYRLVNVAAWRVTVDPTSPDSPPPAKKRPIKQAFELPLSAAHLNEFERAAERAAMNLATWMRDRLVRCAQRENKRN
jgi:hypothetical protein